MTTIFSPAARLTSGSIARPAAAPADLDCADVPIRVTDLDCASDAVLDLALLGGRGHHVHLCSVDTVVQAAADPAELAVLQSSSANLPDGMGILLASRLTQPVRSAGMARIAGTEFMREVWDRGQALGVRHYLLGSTEEVQARLQDRLLRDYPDAKLVGAESPPFRPLTDAERAAQIERIAVSGAQVVWVGLGCPKQDHEAARLAGEVPAVFVAVGAAFDFISDTKRRAPRWMQRSGLEWLFRLGSEPRRLWRRYVLGLPTFFWLVLSDLLSR